MRVRTLATMVVAAAVSITAHASSVTGSVWENGTTTNAPSSTSGLGTATSTFTVSSTGAFPINFSSFGNAANTGNSSMDYTLSSFLTSLGDTVSYSSGAGAAGDGINNDVFEFTGTTFLAPGTYTFTHDDGMYLYLNGSLTPGINSPAPTSPSPSSFTIATGGNYNFDLIYAEVSGPGAVLEGANFPVSVTPEPSSIIMLGSGLLAGAGMIRRRLKA